jgi:protein-disulfide isomerase-like protein with CxxC motif
MDDRAIQELGSKILHALADALDGEVAVAPHNAGLVQKIKDQQADIARLQKLNHLLANDWRRIEKLVGREFTSPESVIDRVAYLVEQEQKGNDETKRWARATEKPREQRDELLRAARAVYDTYPADAGNQHLSSVRELRRVADQIRQEIAGP